MTEDAKKSHNAGASGGAPRYAASDRAGTEPVRGLELRFATNKGETR
jgi:hypothetical protein